MEQAKMFKQAGEDHPTSSASLPCGVAFVVGLAFSPVLFYCVVVDGVPKNALLFAVVPGVALYRVVLQAACKRQGHFVELALPICIDGILDRVEAGYAFAPDLFDVGFCDK